VHYDRQDIMAMEIVKTYLSESILCADEDNRPKGGLHMKDRYLPLNDDMVEINLLGKMNYIGEHVIALININIYHQHPDRITELSKVIKKVLNGAMVQGFQFDFERECYNGTAKRKYHNILFKGNASKSDYQVLLDSYF
jgi:hypothetical protein